MDEIEDGEDADDAAMTPPGDDGTDNGTPAASCFARARSSWLTSSNALAWCLCFLRFGPLKQAAHTRYWSQSMHSKARASMAHAHSPQGKMAPADDIACCPRSSSTAFSLSFSFSSFSSSSCSKGTTFSCFHDEEDCRSAKTNC